MQQELRFATFNVCNLALPGVQYYEDQIPYSVDDYNRKVGWLAQQLDRLDADVIALQEIFSQTAVRDILAKTEKYSEAFHAGFDPATDSDHLTPSVALISRLPLNGDAREFHSLPDKLAIALPGTSQTVTHFTRPILHAQIQAGPALLLNVLVCHLKSKLPDYRHEGVEQRSDQTGIAMLRSLIRRGTDALGLRYLLADLGASVRLPTIVLGDFNDVANAIPTQMVMGLGQYPVNGRDNRLFDCARIQSHRSVSRDIGYTHMHDGNYETIDHILVSEEFNAASPHAIGEVMDVRYLNDHMLFRLPYMSDHGAVLARIRLHGPAVPDGEARKI